MGYYRKISSRIWNDEKFRTLSNNGKLVFLFVLTHPSMTMLGAMRHTIAGLSSELGWSEKAFREALGEAFGKGILKVDERASCIWFPNFLKHNKPESPNVVKSWGKALDLIPECEIKNELIESTRRATQSLPEAFGIALPEGFRIVFQKTLPNQEQEQEQEHKQEQEQTLSADKPPDYGRHSEPVQIEYSEPFKIFWSAYPKKVGKDAAWKVWKANRLDAAIEQVLVTLGATRKTQDWLKEAGKFIPHPTTWLNQGRWKDEIASPVTPPEPELVWVKRMDEDGSEFPDSVYEPFKNPKGWMQVPKRQPKHVIQ